MHTHDGILRYAIQCSLSLYHRWLTPAMTAYVCGGGVRNNKTPSTSNSHWGKRKRQTYLVGRPRPIRCPSRAGIGYRPECSGRQLDAPHSLASAGRSSTDSNGGCWPTRCAGCSPGRMCPNRPATMRENRSAEIE